MTINAWFFLFGEIFFCYALHVTRYIVIRYVVTCHASRVTFFTS